MLDDRIKVLAAAGCQYLAAANDSTAPPSATALAAAGVDSKTIAAAAATCAGASPNTVLCRICVESVPSADTYGVGCGHRFCVMCWRSYIEDKLASAGTAAVAMRCPAFKCGAVVPDASVQHLISHSKELWTKYDQLLIRAFVEESRNMRWCTAPRCEFAVLVCRGIRLGWARPRVVRLADTCGGGGGGVGSQSKDLSVLSVSCQCGNKFW